MPDLNDNPAQITNHLGSGFLHLGNGVHIQRKFTATIDSHPPSGLLLELDVEVDRAGNPHCRSLRFASNPESATYEDDVTTEAIRVPLSTLVHQCFVDAQTPFVEAGEGAAVTFRLGGGEFEIGEIDREELFAAHPRGARRTKQRKPLTDEELQAIARLYRVASENHSPTKLIAEKWHVDRSTARRWVKRAVERGFLDPADRLDPAQGATRRRRTR